MLATLTISNPDKPVDKYYMLQIISWTFIEKMYFGKWIE